MAAAKPAYVEDYNSTISEVVPLSRRQAKKPTTLDTLRENASDSGYEPSQHSSQLSPIVSRTATPANDNSSSTPQAAQEQPQQVPQHREQPQREYNQREREREREHQRYYQDRESQPYTSTPMQRRLSSHLSAQTSSSSSSNPTPSGSRPNSIKATGSRDASPAIHKHQTSHGASNTVESGDSSCDCSQCKTKSSPPAAHNALNTPWNLNYAPFTTAHHTPPYGPNYSNVSPMRSYDYGYGCPPTPASVEPGDAYTEHRRARDRPIPARPLSYGGANPVTTSGSWNMYGGYYGQAQATAQAYSTPSYGPAPINTAVPPTAGPYSAMAGGYNSGYMYSPQDYYSTGAAAIPGSSSAYEASHPIPTRRATTRASQGIQNKSPRNSPGDYHQKNARKYAEEYADNKYPEKYSGGYDRYSRRYTEEYTDRYDDKYHQTAAPVTRRQSQRTSQSSGAYSHMREEPTPTRSTSVPPSETGHAAPPEERRRTKTPGPPTNRVRRDSTSTSNSANAALAGALTRVPKANEYAIYDDDTMYSRTPPTHHGHSRHSSRYEGHYDARYNEYYGHQRHQYYRGSDSSGASSGGAGEDLVVGASDGETESYTMRRPSQGFPVSLPQFANTRRSYEDQNVENFPNYYRYMPHSEYAPRHAHDLAVPYELSTGGQGRELSDFERDASRVRRKSVGAGERGVSPRYNRW